MKTTEQIVEFTKSQIKAFKKAQKELKGNELTYYYFKGRIEQLESILDFINEKD